MDKPILFQDEMVRAIIAGRKTQTRRIVRPNYIPLIEAVMWANGKFVWEIHAGTITSPWGNPGDRLWVRESWAHHPDPTQGVIYRATDRIFWQDAVRWKPSIHMKKKHSRIWLKVISVKPERIQDISEEDAMAEGVDPLLVPPDGGGTPHYEGFIELWNKINGDKEGCAWADNPWVWRIEFERQDPGRNTYPGTKYQEMKI